MTHLVGKRTWLYLKFHRKTHLPTCLCTRPFLLLTFAWRSRRVHQTFRGEHAHQHTHVDDCVLLVTSIVNTCLSQTSLIFTSNFFSYFKSSLLQNLPYFKSFLFLSFLVKFSYEFLLFLLKPIKKPMEARVSWRNKGVQTLT